MVARYGGFVALLLAGCCVCPAQERTAALIGTVGGRGAPLPEVHVLLQSSDSSRTLAAAMTAANGTFRLAGLSCGNDFSLLLSRAGWRTRRIAHLQLRCADTIEVTVTLLPAASASHVSAPGIVDQVPWWGTQFGDLQLQKLPNGRNLWSLLQSQEPSTVTSRIDVDGLTTGQPALFGALGASWTENQYQFHELNVMDPYLPGVPLIAPGLDELAEFLVMTGSKPPSARGSGTDIVLATPQPGGKLHGAARLFYSARALQSDNFNERLARFHFPGPERMNHLRDASVQLGGSLPHPLAALPFFASFSTQQLSKDLGGFPAPIQSNIYRGLADVTAYSRGSQKLDLSLSAQHVSSSHERAALNVAPSATTRGSRSFEQLGAHWSQAAGRSTFFSASAGVVQAVVSSAIQNGAGSASSLDLPDMDFTGAAPLGRSGVRTRYQFHGLAQTIRTGGGTHTLSLGAAWERSDVSNRWYAIDNLQQITVAGVPAEVLLWNTPARTQLHVQNIGEFVQDTWQPVRWISLSPALRVDTSSGRALDGASAINWTTLQPRLGIVIPLWPRGLVLQGSWSRYGHLLQGRYLDFGNPAALGGQVFRWQDVNRDHQVQPSELGALLRVFGGLHSALAPGIARPFTDEISFGAEQDVGAGFSASIRFFRRDDHRLLALNNAGVPFFDYTPVSYLDPGNDGIPGTADDQVLTLYNRLPSALGKDFLLLGNFGFHASYKGMEARLSKRLFRRWAFAASFTASRTLATTNPGNSVFQDDTGFVGTLGADPNTLVMAQGRTHFDRAFTGKVSSYYSAPLGFHLGVAAAYYDGLPFGRMLFVNGFNQGPFFVRANPVGHPGGFQTQLNATLDARIARDFSVPRGVLSGYLDVFNILNANSNTLESDLTGPAFLTRIPLAVEAPRTARLGVEWRF